MAIKTERALFLSVVFAELLHTLVAAGQHRVPASHDGFQFFTLQYYFLSNAAQAHQVAQWIPYMNQGTIASLWHGIQAGLLQSVLLHLPVLGRDADLLTVYHTGMFVDEMILLTGTWLLARRFFSANTVCFIALSVVGATVWLDQPYWNFRLHYAIPLILELGHRFFETSRWRWGFLAVNLLAVQMIGNLPYLIPLVSFVVAAYFAAHAVTNPGLCGRQLRALRWGWPAVCAIAGGAASLCAAYMCFTVGTDSLVSYNAFRAADGTNSLPVFLTYGGATDLLKWIDMALNLSPWMDFTLYSGVLLGPLLCLSVFVMDRRRLHFLILALTLLLFSLGTFVSTVLFYVWPGMKYFRHIGLISPLVRVLWCFVAGVGFERLTEWQPPDRVWSRRLVGSLLLALLAAMAIVAFRLSLNHPAMLALVDAISNPGVDRPAHTQVADVLARRLWTSSEFAIAAGILVGLGAALVGLRRFSAERAWHRAWVLALLVLVAVDVYHFKFAYLFDRSNVVQPSLQFVERPSRMEYPRRRDLNLARAAMDASNPRLNATLQFSPMFRLRLQGRASLGAQYWTNDMFVFADEAGSTFQVDSWLKPLDQLMRMYWRVPIDGPFAFPPGTDLRQLVFPLDHPAAGRVSGVTADKIRFFARAYSVGSAAELPPLMASDGYAGNILFVLRPLDANTQSQPPAAWASQEPLSNDDSQALTYRVETFDANNLRVTVLNPGTASWMSYADVWHPFWRATVNGRPVPVYRANMAYKAVPLEAGTNDVHFEFGSALFSWLSSMLAVNAAFWLGMVAWLIWTAYGTKPWAPAFSPAASRQ